jgi:hypothetical protein
MATHTVPVARFLKEAATASEDPSKNRANLLKRLVYLMTSTFNSSLVKWDGDAVEVPVVFDVDEEFELLEGGGSRQDVASRAQDMYEYIDMFREHGIDVTALEPARCERMDALLGADLPPFPMPARGRVLEWFIFYVPKEVVEIGCNVAFGYNDIDSMSVGELRAMLHGMLAKGKGAVASGSGASPSAVAKAKRVREPTIDPETWQDLYERGMARVKEVNDTIGGELDLSGPDEITRLFKRHGEVLLSQWTKKDKSPFVPWDAQALLSDTLGDSGYTVAWGLTVDTVKPYRSSDPNPRLTGEFLGVKDVALKHEKTMIRCLKGARDADPVLIQFKITRKDATVWHTFVNTTSRAKAEETYREGFKAALTTYAPFKPITHVSERLFPAILADKGTKKPKVDPVSP